MAKNKDQVYDKYNKVIDSNYLEDYKAADEAYKLKDTLYKDYRLYYIGDFASTSEGIANEAESTDPNVPLIYSTIEQYSASLTLQNPTINVEPVEASDAAVARALSNVLAANFEKSKMDQIIHVATRDSLIYPFAYFYVSYDKEANHGLGDFVTSIIPIFNIRLEPTAKRVKEANFIFIKSLLSKYDAFNAFNIWCDENSKDDITGASGVEVIEGWYKKSRLYPKGRHIIWIPGFYSDEEDNNKEKGSKNLVIVDEVNPYKNAIIPIVDIAGEETSAGDSLSLVEVLKDIEAMYRKEISTILRSGELANQPIFQTNDENMPEKVNIEPGTILKVGGDAQLQQFVIQDVSSSAFNLVGLCDSLITKISGQSEILSGIPSGANQAASAITQLTNNGMNRKEGRSKQIANALEDWGIVALTMIAQFYKTDRIIKFLTPEGESLTPELVKSIMDFKKNFNSKMYYDIKLDYSSALPTDKTSRLNLLMQFANSGLIDIDAIADVVGDPILSGAIYDTAKRKKATAEKQAQADAAAKEQQQALSQQNKDADRALKEKELAAKTGEPAQGQEVPVETTPTTAPEQAPQEQPQEVTPEQIAAIQKSQELYKKMMGGQ